MDKRQISQNFTKIGSELISSEPILKYIKDSNVKITFLSSEHEKKSNRKVIFAECEKVPDRFKWAVPCDFTITVFEPNVERFTDEQIKVLLIHEMLHIGIELDGNEEKYFHYPHDIEDFRAIIEKYGIDWAQT